ncbi:hypothetical protein HNV08_07645 [Winogradskyella eckloniae]|uniref:hypothetical protein n=1 Tax=Winogradskyella eckloniae TaxID=1089306 RepID=UPI0015675E26|nr:hypothetical protein [Winogradskyella eckloniae]NRD19916.1 hypothetical protein [Winogradskyella eckloniae]
MKTKLINCLIIFIIIQSCGFNTSPEDYFDTTTLNTNLLTNFGSKDFEHFNNLKLQNGLYTENEEGEWVAQNKLVPHLQTYVIPSLEKKIKEIKDLRPTASTEAMINASLLLHEFTLEKYQLDYLHIAQLIDNQTNSKVITAAIFNLEHSHAEKFWELHKKLTDVALPYAKANNIEVTRY